MATASQQTKSYQRRRPELTPCYKIVQQHLASFLAERDAEGRPMPDFVKEEFEAFLRCGIPAYGFIRLVCGSCRHESVLPFSCKKRGFCPSCCAKRMAEAASHLTENVLPLVPYRQFVISFPMGLRFWLHTNRELFRQVHAICIKSIHRYYTDKATALGVKDPAPGSISFTQRWGSALNLNPHCHILVPDGVYSRIEGQVKFRSIETITDDDVASLIQSISAEVIRLCKRKGYISPESDMIASPLKDSLFAEHDALTEATAGSIAGRIAFGPRAGEYVRRIGGGFGYGEEVPLAKGKLCYSVNGFSLHANTHINTHARDRLAKLVEYVARGPLSNERLEILPSGDIKLTLKTSWRSGVTHLLFTPPEFIEKLTALIPPPRQHLVRWAGIFAPNSPYRKEIILDPSARKGFAGAPSCQNDATHDGVHDGLDESLARRRAKGRLWSKMLMKVFKIDVTKCISCGGEVRMVAAITEPLEVRRYLKHEGIDYEAPARGPPRVVQEEFAFEYGLDASFTSDHTD